MRTIIYFHNKNKVAKIKIWATALAFSSLTPTYVAAVDVLTQIEDERARILFDWQQNVDIVPTIVGNQLSIQFSQNEQIDVRKLLSSLRPYVVNASQPNGRQIILTLDEAYGLQAFKDGKANGVDLLIKDAKAKPLDPNEVTTDKSILTTEPSKVRGGLKKDKINPMLTTEPQAEGKPQSELSTKQIAPKKDIAKNPLLNAKSNAKSNAGIAKDEAAQSRLYALANKMNKGKMVVGVKKTPISGDFFFPFHERTAAATLQYGGDLYVIFSHVNAVDVEKLSSALPSFIGDVEQIYHNSATILRFKAQPSTQIYSKAKQTGKGYEWQISMMRRPQLPNQIITPELVSKPPIKPHVFLNAMQLAEMMVFKEPITGENITIIPSYENGSGVYPERISPDLTVLATGQGVAFIPSNNDIKILRLRQGIRLTRMGGLNISDNIPNIPAEQLSNISASNQSFFPYESWKAKDDVDFAEAERNFLREISLADERKIPALRLGLTKLYMAEGLYMEALGLLELLQTNSPDFYADYQLAALEAAADFMVGRSGEAERLFNDETLQDADEIKLWQRAMQIAGGKRLNFDYFDYDKRYIHSYPPAMRRKLAILAVDNALAQKKYNLAKNILNKLNEAGLGEPLENYAAYVNGRIAAENGDLETAEKILQPLIDDTEDNFIRSRAAFSLATNRYKQGKIDRAELIAALRPVQLLWRGDNFELNVLNLLGELYVNNNQTLEGLRAWRDVITYFPTSEIALEVAGRMANTFVEFFNEGGADAMTPLQALSLYYEFRDLTPIGEAGDKMVQQLADRLVAVDLLDKAAKLLEYQVTYRLDKAERSKIGTKLAMIYLLNREPEKSLKVLELTGYGANNEGLNRKRNHIAAIAYGKLGKWQTAINLLRDDYSKDAKYIRSDIYWDIKDWYNLAINLEEILGSRKVATDPLNEQETQTLLRLCVAYSFMGDSKQLAYLRDYFTPLVAQEQDKQTFAFLTSATDVVNRENITRITEEVDKMSDFLDNYQVNLKDDKLSNELASIR